MSLIRISAATVASVFTIIAGTLTPAHSDTKSDIAKCAVIKGDLDRLNCYDGLAKVQGLNGPQSLPVAVSGTGKWQIHRDKNPIDDSERVILTLRADKGTSKFEGPIAFLARCQSKKTEAYIEWGEYLGNDGDFDDGYKVVTVRIGDQPAKKQRWSISTDSKATFAPNWAGDLLKEMARTDKFIAKVTPYNENPITAIFDTSGMKAALHPLIEVCGWTLNTPDSQESKK